MFHSRYCGVLQKFYNPLNLEIIIQDIQKETTLFTTTFIEVSPCLIVAQYPNKCHEGVE